jgi:hypothetical protein
MIYGVGVGVLVGVGVYLMMILVGDAVGMGVATGAE